MTRPMVGRKPKLTADQLRQLREWAALGRSTGDWARRYGVHTSTIAAYLRGARKAHQEKAA